MKSYMANKDFIKEPLMLRKVEEAGIDLNELNYGLMYVFSLPTNENNEWLNSETTSTAEHFVYLADATASGSEYFFWVRDKTKALEFQPIMIFGDEGQINLVAKDFNDWLSLMAIGDEANLNFGISGCYIPLADEDNLSEDRISNLHKLRELLKKEGLKTCSYTEDDFYEFQEAIYKDALMYKEEFVNVLELFNYSYEDYDSF